jgi:hypothetical protein
MRQPMAMPILAAYSTTFSLSTGSTPGMPAHTAQTFSLGSAPKEVEQEQNILLLVRNWACTSRPMTASYRDMGLLREFVA